MAKTLGNALGTDLNQVAALLRSKGRRGDTVLAHINPEEAALLKARGGSGTINPETGLPEFWEWTSPSTWFGGDSTSAADVQQYDDYPSQQQIDAGTALSTETSSLPDYQYIYDQPSFGGAEYFQPQAYQYEAAPAVQAPAAGGFGTAEPFVGTPQFGVAEQFGAGGVPVTPDSFAGQQIDQDIAAQQPEKGMLERFEETVKKYPSTSAGVANLLKFGLGGLATVPLIRQQKTAAQNTQQMADEIAALGQPIRQQGLQALSQAQAGQLTPAQRQAVAGARAQTQQSLSRQGITSGVAQQQSEANIQRLTEQYVANNINNALQMVNLGNRYAQSAITQGYNANQQANQAANLFYQNLFAMMGGYAPRVG
jgi:surface antigen